MFGRGGGGCGGSGGRGFSGGSGAGVFVGEGLVRGVVVVDVDWAEEGFLVLGVGDIWSWRRGLWQIGDAEAAQGVLRMDPQGMFQFC